MGEWEWRNVKFLPWLHCKTAQGLKRQQYSLIGLQMGRARIFMKMTYSSCMGGLPLAQKKTAIVENQKNEIQRRKKNDRPWCKKKNPGLNLDLKKTTRELTFIGQILQIYLADHSQKQKKCHSPKCSLECKQKLSRSKLTAKSKTQNEMRCPSTHFPAIKSFQYIYQTFLLQLEFHFPVFFNPSFLCALFWILIPLIPL